MNELELMRDEFLDIQGVVSDTIKKLEGKDVDIKHLVKRVQRLQGWMDIIDMMIIVQKKGREQ